MKWMISLSLALAALAACNAAGSTADSAPTRATSMPSGLEEVRILARGME